MKLKQIRKKGSVVRSNGAAARGGGRRGLLDPAVSVPIVTAGRAAKLRIAPRTDFVPAGIPKALVGAVALGDTLLDIFTPRYVGSHASGAPWFFFQFSRCQFTQTTGWYLRRTTMDWPHLLRFFIRPDAEANYLRVVFGQNTDIESPRSILRVRVESQVFDADITHRSHSFLDVVLPAGSPNRVVELALDVFPPGQTRVLATIEKIELYRTIRAFPSDRLDS